jgi:hypothetical protein
VIRQSKPLDSALASIDKATSPDDKHRATARGLMRGYDARYAADNTWRAEAVEQEFRHSIYNLQAAKRTSTSRTFTVAGKKDVLGIDEQDRRWVFDHKTTSYDIAVNSDFRKQLVCEGQVNCYLLSELLSGQQAAGAVWDMIRKPGIAPKLLSKADKTMITSLGTYFGMNVSSDTQVNIADTCTADAGLPKGTQIKYRENGELFEIRLTQECLDQPERYFQRQKIFKLDHEMELYAKELWELAQDILIARRTGRHLRSSGACLNFGACGYLGICSGYDSPDSNNWIRRANVHEELSTLNGDGRNVLTNSRLRCFQTCRRKHYYRYELGIERVDHKESDALVFGTLMHKALEAWWSHFLTPTQPQEENDYGNRSTDRSTSHEQPTEAFPF